MTDACCRQLFSTLQKVSEGTLAIVCLTRPPGAADQAAPQVRAAIARAAQAGLPPARQREAEAQLRQRDAAAAERLCICASATPFSLAAYQDALNTAVRFELCECYPQAGLRVPFKPPLNRHSLLYREEEDQRAYITV